MINARLEKTYDTPWKYGIYKTFLIWGWKVSYLLLFQIFYLIDNLMSELIQLILTFRNKRWEFPRKVSSVTLLSIKINSLAKVLNDNIEGYLYVDDFLICYRGKHMIIIERQLQLCLNKIAIWAMENGFKLSSSKTVGMHLCIKWRLHPDPELRVYNSPIKIVPETNVLDLLFDSKHAFLPHIKMLKNKCLQSLNILKFVSCIDWGADSMVLLYLCRSLIRSKLD